MLRIFFICIWIGFLVVIDVISKYWAESALMWKVSLQIIPDFVTLKLAYNPGIAFSLPIEWVPLQIITIMLIGALIYYYIHDEYGKHLWFLDCAYMLILAWAIAHAYERIMVGHVVDFIAVKYFAILNFADIFISIGVGILIIYYSVYEYRWKPRS